MMNIDIQSSSGSQKNALHKPSRRRPRLKQIEYFIAILKQHKQELVRQYKVKSLGVFGSYVRHEQKKDSDLDVLVEFNEGDLPSLFEFVELELHLSELLGVKVDLVEKDGLKPRIGAHILAEAVPI